MSQACPALRPELIVSRQGSEGEASFVIKDPAQGRFFRLREPEYFIARQLDGTVSLQRIQGLVHEQLGLALSEENLRQFVERLRAARLLQDPHDSPHRPRRLAGSLFYLRLKAFDPDRLLGFLHARLRWLFTPGFLIASIALIALSASIAVGFQDAIALDISRLFHVSTLFFAWLTIFLVITIHEFAHGVTCRHFGGRVHDMGFMFFYFHPTFYCNVSDAWLFPRRSHRMWVTVAGAGSELMIWAMATLTWRITEPGTVVSSAALVIMATSGIRSLFNLNPLIKLDGYYLLIDAVQIPNLRVKAFGYLKEQFRRLVGMEVAASGATSRERRIYVIYGLLAALYSSWLFGIIAFYTARALTRNLQAWGFFLFLGLLGMVFNGPIRNSLSVLHTPEKPGPSRRSRLLKLARIPALLVVVGILLTFVRMELGVSGEFTLAPAKNTDIRAEVEGIIQKVYVDEGVRVGPGDIIARLSARDYTAQVRMLDAQIAEQQARLSMLKSGPRLEEIQLATTAVDKASERLVYSRGQLARHQTLFGEKLLSESELLATQEEVAVRVKELEEANGRLDILRAGSRQEEVDALDANIRRLSANRAYVQEEITSLKVVSPIAGVIATPKLKELVGQQVKKGDLIAKVLEVSSVTAEIAVPEKEISDVQVGQKVVLRTRAYPDLSIIGSVAFISPTVVKPEAERMERFVTVTTVLENPNLLLKPEMTGNAKILCGRRTLAQLMTRRIERYLRVEFWSWW
ncbi:MAG TPA: efflux RND transporter periplasmic adaptor subunit [Candidatus Polarisedimenticolia bacterium]|nr:efflux RND transporter periplasmic adaptor subunit [Candidatus Polarisedimenticolia bacterium]